MLSLLGGIFRTLREQLKASKTMKVGESLASNEFIHPLTRSDTTAAKLDIGKFGDEQRKSILNLAEQWRRHSVYWQQAPLLTHTLRYEDLKAQPIPHVSLFRTIQASNFD